MRSTIIKSAVTTSIVLFASQATALFDCNKDEHDFAPDAGYFVAHYTSIRDSNTGLPWVRICIPSDDGDWDQRGVLETDCSDDATTFGTDRTGLNHDLKVVDGHGCDDGESDLSGGSLEYNGKKVNLQDGGDDCGPRDHGISCQFKI